MAIGGANISRGMGRGAAQVYNTSAPVDAYAKLVQQQQLKREKETKEIQDQFGKLTPEGLRKQDVPGFIEESNKWKSLAIEANSIKDPVQKALKAREAEQAKMNAFAYAQESKDEKKKDDAFYSKSMDPKWRDEFEDDGIAKYTKARQLSIKDPNFIRDMSGFVRKVDTSKTIADINKIKEALFDLTPPKIIQKIGKMGSDEGTFATEVTEVDPLVYAETIKKAFNIDPNLRVGLNKMYPQFKDLPNNEFIDMVAPEIVKNFPAIKYGSEKFISKKGGMTEYQRRMLALKEGGEDQIGSSNKVIVRPKNFIGTQLPMINPKTGKPALSSSGKQKLGGEMVTSEFPVYSSVNPTPFELPQVESAFNIGKAKNERLDAGTYKLTGIGYNVVKGGGKQLRATITDEDDNEYVVNPSNLPADVRGDKYYKKVLSAVEDEYKKYSSNKIKSQSGESKIYSKSQEELINKNLEANPAYTRAEIIEALGL